MMNRVLLVDDDESILFALRRIVTRRGWEPLVARSGSEAIELVDRALAGRRLRVENGRLRQDHATG
jgi:ActR/RegA family two-component response regulator